MPRRKRCGNAAVISRHPVEVVNLEAIDLFLKIYIVGEFGSHRHQIFCYQSDEAMEDVVGILVDHRIWRRLVGHNTELVAAGETGPDYRRLFAFWCSPSPFTAMFPNSCWGCGVKVGLVLEDGQTEAFLEVEPSLVLQCFTSFRMDLLHKLFPFTIVVLGATVDDLARHSVAIFKIVVELTAMLMQSQRFGKQVAESAF